MSFAPGDRPLYRWERAGLVLLGLFLLSFAALVEIRSAFQSQRKTDLGVYLRAGWAVRTGADLYQVTCDRGWHFVYPPAFAVAMVPFADAPPGEPRSGMLPYSVTVALWILVNFALVGWVVHSFARLALPDAVAGTRRWWYARLIPIYVCVGGIGFTISHGQVNLLVVALLAGMFAASVTGRSARAGGWLAAAVVLKVIPALLLLYPLIRREYRAAVGLAIGLVAGLVAVPVLALGPARTADAYRSFLDRVLLPGVSSAGDRSLGRELVDEAGTDSQSFQSAIHAGLYPDRSTRPRVPSTGVRLAHWGLVGVLAVAVASAGRRRGSATPADKLVLLGLLGLLMLHAAPASHMHYYAFGLPLVAGLWLKGLANRPGLVWPGWRAAGPVVAWGVATALPLLDGAAFAALREHGLGPAASVGLFAVGVGQMGRPAASGGPVVDAIPEAVRRRAA